MNRKQPSSFEIATLLITKYEIHKKDLHFHMESFRNHVRNVQIAGTLAILSSSYLLFNADYKPTPENSIFWITFVFVLITLACYLLHDVLYASYQIVFVSERMATIENELNAIVRKKLFFWESGFVEKFNRSVFNPQFYTIFYGTILFLALVIGVPAIVISKIWPLHCGLSIAVLIYAAFSLSLAIFLIVMLHVKTRKDAQALLRTFVGSLTRPK